MSEVTEAPITTTEKPSKAKPRKPVATSSIHVRFATSKGIDTTRAAKLNRSYMRANFATLVKQWPSLKASGKQGADNIPWPKECPAHVADAIVKRTLVKAAK